MVIRSKNKTPIYYLLLSIAALLFSPSCSRDSETKTQIKAIPDKEEKGLKDCNPKVKVGAHFRFIDDSKYLEISENEFNANQVLFYAGFGGWISRSEYNFDNLNTSVNWLFERNISSHVHMLFGPDQYMPDWLKNGSFTADELDTLMQEYIGEIMNANDNKAKVDIWNVINELFNDDGTYRDDMVWNQMGFEVDNSDLSGEEKINSEHPIFIRKAFEYCRKETNAKLEYRDYIIENNNPGTGWDKKHKATYQLLKHMLNTNIPLDAIGIQGHFNIGEVDWVLQDNGLQNVVAKFKALGLEVYITELDIGLTGEHTDAIQQQQETDFYNYVFQSLEGGAERIYMWGVQDGADLFWRTDEKPLLWDSNFERKNAYFGVKRALEDAIIN